MRPHSALSDKSFRYWDGLTLSHFTAAATYGSCWISVLVPGDQPEALARLRMDDPLWEGQSVRYHGTFRVASCRKTGLRVKNRLHFARISRRTYREWGKAVVRKEAEAA